MTSFIYGTQINLEIETMIANAEEFMWLISPYIKLHQRIKEELLTKKDDHKLRLVVVFGKNENDLAKSMSKEDMEFFMQFPNVAVYYEANLHAKFYANDFGCLLTSMNLHQFSQNNNIEAGFTLTAKSTLKRLASIVTESEDPARDALNYFEQRILQAFKLFDKRPQYESGFLSQKYTGSIIEVDKKDEFFSKVKTENKTATYSTNWQKDYSQSIEKTITVNEKNSTPKSGFCIRTGKPIPFNTLKPMCAEAYTSWSQFKNMDYKEKYCHKTGQPSHGKTSMRNPILQ